MTSPVHVSTITKVLAKWENLEGDGPNGCLDSDMSQIGSEEAPVAGKQQ